MKVYRVIEYEGSAQDIAEMFRLSINGSYHTGALRIVATPIEPRIIKAVPMIVHALALASEQEWAPPDERTPKPPATAPAAVSFLSAADNDDAVQLLRTIEELCEGDHYEWAGETLDGIRNTIERTGRATVGQRIAVTNIANARGGWRRT